MVTEFDDLLAEATDVESRGIHRRDLGGGPLEIFAIGTLAAAALALSVLIIAQPVAAVLTIASVIMVLA